MIEQPSSLEVFSPQEIKNAVNISDIVEPVGSALAAYSQGRALRTPLGLLRFTNRGEAHVKSGYEEGGDFYVTKVATMVAANRSTGLHTSDGVMILCSAISGFPLAVLHDQKFLTDIRTAAVGTIAARLLAPSEVETVGVFGTGGQAFLQVEALYLVRRFSRIMIWGREDVRAAMLADRFKIRFPDLEVCVFNQGRDVASEAQVIVTATASTSPILEGEWLQPGTHVTAMGADDAEKCELDPVCFARANYIIVDSRKLADQLGDIPYCRRLQPSADITVAAELGELLTGHTVYERQQEDITISKHIGLGVEDLATAVCCYRLLSSA